MMGEPEHCQKGISENPRIRDGLLAETKRATLNTHVEVIVLGSLKLPGESKIGALHLEIVTGAVNAKGGRRAAGITLVIKAFGIAVKEIALQQQASQAPAGSFPSNAMSDATPPLGH